MINVRISIVMLQGATIVKGDTGRAVAFRDEHVKGSRMISRPDSLAVAIASDHAGFDLKTLLVDWLRMQGHAVADLGPDDTTSVDYPDYGYTLARAVASGDAAFGVAICGSGIGMSIAVNRHPGVRCALVDDSLSARLAREHNDANIIAFGARLIGIDTAKDALAVFLATRFSGDRHSARVAKLGHPVFEKDFA